MNTKENKSRSNKKRPSKKTQKTPDTEFASLGLNPKVLARLDKLGYKKPSPIQEQFIPIALTGRDVTGQAQTGTGKTAAFGLPILEQMDPRLPGLQAIILTPTRELSEQVSNELERLGPKSLKMAVLVGGRPIRKQIRDLENGAQMVVGTPGRVIDLLFRKDLVLDQVKFVVLDEADRMLDIGFRPDIEKIMKRCPEQRQTLLLSATMSSEVERLAKRYMIDPDRVDLSEKDVANKSIQQFYISVDADRKISLMAKFLLQERPQQVLVFTRTKRGAERLYKTFAKKLKNIAVIHGDLAQPKRDSVIKEFRGGKTRMLIATDVVGRGIDISGISHIINYDVPEFCDDYVHRIGRAGRLSSVGKGQAITFVTREQGSQLTEIEKRINMLLDEYEIKDFQPVRPRPPKNY
ncbi:DEAD-box ATP-dependent RNA helicase CshA [Polystyrenella longa]|uniref:DEAD-box ATP-dependent RNA helicase CshA n=1 Tax=Polystyrenella longa TaxID=2528007 RepID=A0A518CMZ8_9PLAN|nr:DEAD/DEAH box helicase [Polystyrenella longa]QDU80602.1 DEAD-box ATP-dependent RNA helicase CshA [Polystyrenella longa]